MSYINIYCFHAFYLWNLLFYCSNIHVLFKFDYLYQKCSLIVTLMMNLVSIPPRLALFHFLIWRQEKCVFGSVVVKSEKRGPVYNKSAGKLFTVLTHPHYTLQTNRNHIIVGITNVMEWAISRLQTRFQIYVFEKNKNLLNKFSKKGSHLVTHGSLQLGSRG